MPKVFGVKCNDEQAGVFESAARLAGCSTVPEYLRGLALQDIGRSAQKVNHQVNPIPTIQHQAVETWPEECEIDSFERRCLEEFGAKVVQAAENGGVAGWKRMNWEGRYESLKDAKERGA